MKYIAFLLTASAMMPTALFGCIANAAQPQSQDTPADQQAGSTESGGADASQLGDIVVTAQKREESAQRAPVAITAVGGDELAARGVVDVRQLSTLVPSARFNLENNVATTYIRGVGIGFSNPAVPEAVGLQVNGVFTPLFATGGQLFDVERVEVLPGPQGTLYGRSSVGGIINITTRRPKLNEDGLDASIELGNYDSVHFSGAANIALAQNVAIRTALDVDQHDAYNTNGTDNRNALGGRVSLLAEPSDALSIYLWANYSRNRSRPSPLLYNPGINGDPRDVPAFDPSTAFLYPPNGVDTRDVFSNNRILHVGGQVDWTFGDIKASYIPGYVWNKANEQRVLVGFATPVR